MLNFLLSNIKNVGYMVVAFFTVYILKRNNDLSVDNNNLKQDNLQKDKILDIQAKVLDVSENTKSVNLDANIKRMQGGSYSRIPVVNLPEMPVAGESVANEIKAVCLPNKCPNLNNWLNELYVFKAKYIIYKEELKK